jgi:spore germination protein KB
MLEGGKISGRQAVYLLVATILPSSILFLPHLMYIEARQDAWLSVMLVTLFGLAAGDIIARLGRRFPGQTVIEYSQVLLGRIPGRLVGLTLVGLFICLNAFIIREFGELLVIHFMPETPLVVFVASTILVAVYVVRHGLEVLARVNDIFLPVVIIMLLFLVLLVIPELHPAANLLPVLENGFNPVARGAVPAGVFFAATFVMLMLIPYMSQPRQARRVIARAVLTVGAFQLLIVLVVISTLGPLTANKLFPALILAREIDIAAFITNLDPLILLSWIAGGLIKVAVFHYCATLATAQVFGVRNYGPVTVVNGAVLGLLTVILWEDAVELTYQAVAVLPYFLTLIVGIPAGLLLVAVIRKKGVLPRARR